MLGLQQVLLGLIILMLTVAISFELVFFIKSQYRGIDSKYCECKNLTETFVNPRSLNGIDVGENDLNYIVAIFQTNHGNKCKHICIYYQIKFY